MGRNCRFLQGPDTDKGAIAELRAGIAAAKNVIVELVNYRKDGTKFWNQARAFQERERAGWQLESCANVCALLCYMASFLRSVSIV